MRSASGLRADIQGLRGLAVVLVVLDHAFGWPNGGFLGVDVFFVISGFVITSGLLRERAKHGHIRLGRFALRRVRRLLPASLAVLTVTVAAGLLILPSGRIAAFLTDAGASLLAVANWRFAADGTGYFAADAPPSPFQHFWSLSVEEQFYLVLPLLLVLLLGKAAPIGGDTPLGFGRRRFAVAVLSVIAVASLGWAFVAVANTPDTAYFSTFTRAWELLLGVLVAFASTRVRTVWRPVVEVGTVVGLLAVLVPALVGQDTDGVPAPLALVPTIGTALLLFVGAGHSATAAWPIRTGPLVGLGTISYSLYLWHWPLIVLLPLALDVPMPVGLAVSLGAAIASYLVIERPFRTVALGNRGQTRAAAPSWWATNRSAFRTGGIITLVLANVVGLVVAVDRTAPVQVAAAELPAVLGSDRPSVPSDPVLAARYEAISSALGDTAWPASPQPSVDAITGSDYAESITRSGPWSSTLGCSKVGAAWKSPSCSWGDASGTKVMVVGDSTAAFSMPAWRALAETSGSGTHVVNGTRIGCPFISLELPSNADSCAGHIPDVVEEIERSQPDVLVVTNRWWDANDPDMKSVSLDEYQASTREQLDQVRSSVGRIVLAPAVPPGPPPADCLVGTKKPTGCIATTGSLAAQTKAIRTMSKAVDGAFIDTASIWCVEGRCPVIIGDAFSRLDIIHQAPDGARSSAPALLQLMRQAGALPKDPAKG